MIRDQQGTNNGSNVLTPSSGAVEPFIESVKSNDGLAQEGVLEEEAELPVKTKQENELEETSAGEGAK